MGVYRSLIVWIAAVLVILGVFLGFVAGGWPGEPDSCLTPTADADNTCYCEEFDRADVLAGEPGVRQEVNTWVNLYAIATSFTVAFVLFLDRQALGDRSAPNLMKSNDWTPDLYVFAVLFLGLGSMWFHASLKQWGGILDGTSMYAYAAFLVFYSIRRMWDSAWFFWIGYLATVGLFTFLHTQIPSVINIIILVVAYLTIEVIIWIRSGKVMQGKTVTIILWVSAAVSILAATFFWAASQTGSFMCEPGSAFQPHGLLWHPLAGVMAVLLYFYWREASDPV